MSDGLVKRLRDPFYTPSLKSHAEAADRIEKLEAALREIIGSDELSFVPPILRNIAIKALEGKDD